MAIKTPGAALRRLRERAGIGRDKLARMAGVGGGTTIQGWEDDGRRAGKLFPYRDLAKLAVVLIGRGTPPIMPSEIWELCDGSPDLDTAMPMRAVPVVEWREMTHKLLKFMHITGFTHLPASEAGPNCFAAPMIDDHAAAIAAPGALIVVDPDQAALEDGRRYILRLDGQPRLMRYHSNPARFEWDGLGPRPIYFPSGPVEVIGRAVRVITEI